MTVSNIYAMLASILSKRGGKLTKSLPALNWGYMPRKAMLIKNGEGIGVRLL